MAGPAALPGGGALPKQGRRFPLLSRQLPRPDPAASGLDRAELDEAVGAGGTGTSGIPWLDAFPERRAWHEMGWVKGSAPRPFRFAGGGRVPRPMGESAWEVHASRPHALARGPRSLPVASFTVTGSGVGASVSQALSMTGFVGLQEASERHIAATRDYFAAGFAVNKAEEEAGEALPHLAKNAALRAAEEAKQKAAQILARAKAKIPMLEQRLKYCEGAKETAQKRAEKIREPEVRRERKTIKTKEERAKEEAARQAAIAAERARRAEEARKVLEAEEAELSKIREHEERLARADEERAKITSKVSEEKRKAQQRIAEERKKVMDEMAKLAQEEGKKGELEAAARLAEVRMQREALQGRMHELDHQREFVEAAMRGEKQLDEVLGEAASQPEKIMRTITMVKMRMQQEEVPDDSLERARRRMEEHRKKMAEKIAAKREELNAEREAKRAEMEVEEQRKMSHLTRGASNVSAATLVSTQPKEEARREMRERRAAETEALRKRQLALACLTWGRGAARG